MWTISYLLLYNTKRRNKLFQQSRHFFLPFTVFYMEMKTEKVYEMVVFIIEQQCGIWSYDKMNMKTSLLWCYAVQFGKKSPEHRYILTKPLHCKLNINLSSNCKPLIVQLAANWPSVHNMYQYTLSIGDHKTHISSNVAMSQDGSKHKMCHYLQQPHSTSADKFPRVVLVCGL